MAKQLASLVVLKYRIKKSINEAAIAMQLLKGVTAVTKHYLKNLENQFGFLFEDKVRETA